MGEIPKTLLCNIYPLKGITACIEVRFQRNTSKIYKTDAAVFRLKNLTTMEYATNLCKYLDQSRSVTNLSIGDLRNVLTGLNGASLSNTNTGPRDDESTVSTVTSRTIIHLSMVNMLSIWYDDNLKCFDWTLGVVDSLVNEDIYVSNMIRTDKRGLKWLFPEDADTKNHKT